MFPTFGSNDYDEILDWMLSAKPVSNYTVQIAQECKDEFPLNLDAPNEAFQPFITRTVCGPISQLAAPYHQVTITLWGSKGAVPSKGISTPFANQSSVPPSSICSVPFPKLNCTTPLPLMLKISTTLCVVKMLDYSLVLTNHFKSLMLVSDSICPRKLLSNPLII